MTGSAKKLAFNALRIAVCIGGLYLVVRGVSLDDIVRLDDGRSLRGAITGNTEDSVTIVSSADGEIATFPKRAASPSDSAAFRAIDVHYGLRSTLKSADVALLIVAVFIFVPGTLLQGQRFRWMLRAQDIHIGYLESLKLCYVGNFLNFAYAIGGTAGDVYKMYCVARHSRRKTASVMSVLLDRVVGLVGLVLLVAVLALLTPALRPYRWTLVGILLVGATAAFLYFWPPLRRRVPQALLNRVPRIDFLRKIDQTACNLVRHRSLTLGAILSTVLLQMFCIGSYVVAAAALGFAVDRAGRVFEFFAYFGTGWVITVIPISVQGAGAVELFYTEIAFKPYGSVSQILCLALAVRMLQIVNALPGAVLFLLGAHHLPSSEELEKLEEDSTPVMT